MFVTGGDSGKNFLAAVREVLDIDLTVLSYQVLTEKEIVKLKLLGGLSWEEYHELVQ